MAKNKHNQEVGSTIERSDERIKETQEVFTPQELVESMIDDILCICHAMYGNACGSKKRNQLLEMAIDSSWFYGIDGLFWCIDFFPIAFVRYSEKH
jgi:hypothetical protein